MSSDFRDLLEAFNDFQVDYLLVGGLAVIEYTEPRYTKDMDLWIRASAENAERVYAALTRFGAPLAGVSAIDFAEEGFFFQIGVPPTRIDILMSLPGVDFESAWHRRSTVQIWRVKVPIISITDLITNKRAVGRKQDLIDVEALEMALRETPR